MYKQLICSILILLSCPNQFGTKVVGDSVAKNSDNETDRIINGKPITIESVPSQASLFRRSIYICGVAFISRRTAITAGHCVADIQYQPELLEIHYSSSQISSERRSKVQRISLFPAYSTMTLNYDIAVLTLSSPIDIQYAELPPIGEPIGDGTQLTSVGWGTTENGSTSVQLLMTNLVTVSLEQCRLQNAGWLVSDNVFCAVGDASTTCHGDSGSGVYFSGKDSGKRKLLNRLLGLVSWGDIRCSPSPARPAGFVDLSNRVIREWLRLLVI